MAGLDGAGVGFEVGGAGVPVGGPAGWSPSTGLAGVSPVASPDAEGGLSSVRPAPASAVRPSCWLELVLVAVAVGAAVSAGVVATSGTEDCAELGVGAGAVGTLRGGSVVPDGPLVSPVV